MPAGGDPRTSATEIYRYPLNRAPIEAQRKRARWERGNSAYRVSFAACSKVSVYMRELTIVRVKRWGKSPPGPWRHGFYAVNSIRSNAVEEHIGLPDRSKEAA